MNNFIMINFNTSLPQNYHPSENIPTWTQSQTFNLDLNKKPITNNIGARPSSNYFAQAENQQKPIPSAREGIVNISQLSQDLKRLKQQLKRLSNQQQDTRNLQPGRQTLIQKQAQRPKSNLSSDSHLQFRKEFSYQGLSYPTRNSLPVKNVVNQTAVPQNNERESISEQRVESKIIPILNPNKRESQRWSNIINTQSRYHLTNSQEETSALKQRVTTLQKQLQISKKENQNLQTELKQTYQKLKNKEQQVDQYKLNQKEAVNSEQIKKQLELQRNQHLLIVQKLNQEMHRMKKGAVLPVSLFDETLKEHIIKNQQLQKQLQDKSQQVNSLIDQISDQFKTIQDMKGQLQIQSLKTSADFKAKIQRLIITVSDKENQILTLKRSLETLDCRYRSTLRELQQKDDFILKYMVHRSDDGQKKDISQFFNTYKSQFQTPATLELFLKEQQELQQLKKKVQIM